MNFEQIVYSARMIMEAAADTAAAGGAVSGSDVYAGSCGTMNPIAILIMYAAAGVAIFVMYRNQKKRREQDEAVRRDVEVGDEIVTIGGIIGRIVSVKEDDVIVIETGADRTKLKMKNWCVSSNESAKARAAEQAAIAAKEKKPGLFGTKK